MTTDIAAAPAPAAAAPFSAASLAAPAQAAAPEPASNDQPAAATDTPPDGEAPALKMPAKDASPEEWAAFYNQLGRPETPDAYELPLPEGDDGAFAKQIAPILHKHGLTGEQTKGLAADWNNIVADITAQNEAAEIQQMQAMDAKNRAEEVQLKNEWGQNFDANMHFAKLAVGQFFPKDQAADVISAIESKIGYKATIQFMHNIGKGLGEHDAAGLGSNNGEGGGVKSLAERLYPNTK